MSLDDRTHEGYRRMLRYELQRPARTQALPPPPSFPPSAVHLRLKAASAGGQCTRAVAL